MVKLPYLILGYGRTAIPLQREEMNQLMHFQGTFSGKTSIDSFTDAFPRRTSLEWCLSLMPSHDAFLDNFPIKIYRLSCPSLVSAHRNR